MLYIIALIIFFAVHAIPLNQTLRGCVTDKLGKKPYLGLFVLVIIGSIVMIAQGWNNFPNIYFYEPPIIMKQVHLAIMLPVVYLWVAAEVPNNLKRFIKHPMLMGMKLWALGHLLANGDLRSTLLFISILIFSIIAVVVVNKRGEFKENKSTPIIYDIGVIAVSIMGYGTMAYYHGNLFGVQVIPYFTGS